jgi:hypothetical protein
VAEFQASELGSAALAHIVVRRVANDPLAIAEHLDEIGVRDSRVEVGVRDTRVEGGKLTFIRANMQRCAVLPCFRLWPCFREDHGL